MFTDRVLINFSAGNGGNGVVAWRREKYIPKGGPAGGDGGKGGSIILEADNQILSLENLRGKKHISAENGRGGGGGNRSGRNGRDLIIKVPVGTLIKHEDHVIYDLTQDKEQWVLCKGGFGGKGNTRFKTSKNRAPNICTEGKKGQSQKTELELKLIADVGLIGMPNAGKSTLISCLTNVKVKMAPYPFTTLIPNIGMMQCEDLARLMIADIPGIIKGAHQNRGLGLEFIKHIERTSLLIFLLDASCIDGRHPIDDFQLLQKELQEHNPKILEKPFLVVLNKIDCEGSFDVCAEFKKDYPFDPSSLFEISALTKQNVDALKKEIQKLALKS